MVVPCLNAPDSPPPPPSHFAHAQRYSEIDENDSNAGSDDDDLLANGEGVPEDDRGGGTRIGYSKYT